MPFSSTSWELLMLVVDHRDRPVILSGSGHPSLSMVVNREVGARSMSVWKTFHQPGEVVPLHTHDYEEIITVIAGEAIVTVASESNPVRADMSIVIPPHTPHGYKNSGDGVLRMIASFPDPDAVLGKRVDPPSQDGESTRP
jgi:quercetin dioxygenase-like cupin family protein